MDKSLGFELQILGRMNKKHSESVLREIGLSEFNAKRLREQCVLKLPIDADAGVGQYTELLGEPVYSEPVDEAISQSFGPSTLYLFQLMLWPNMLWSIKHKNGCKTSAHCSWNVGFQAPELRGSRFDPSLVRAGYCARNFLEARAVECRRQSCWDERVVEHLRFQKVWYEAEFVYGLLQSWREIDIE